MKILSKTLSETDVKKRCAVPMKYFKRKRFPKLQGDDKVDFVVKDESGQDHTLCCSKRKLGNDPNQPKHPKPVLIKGWIPFVRKKKLRAGDTVIIYEEQDEGGSMQRRIKVEKRTSPAEAHCSTVMNQNLDGNKGSTTNNGDNESSATFQPFGISSDVLNPELGGTNSATSTSIDKEQIPTPHSTSQDIYKTERPSLWLSYGKNPSKPKKKSLWLSLELTLQPTVTGGFTAATSSRSEKEQTPLPHNTSQGITNYRNLSFGLTLNPNMTGGQQHAYMQETEPKTIDFLGSFL